jgi:hypothetical protein
VSVVPLVVTPAVAHTPAGTSQLFSANSLVNWSASCGTITSSGIFTAPSAPQTCTITATDVGNISAFATDYVSDALGAVGNYLTWKNDNQRTGQQLNETQLTAENVNPTTFGVKFTVPLDGQVYAQPLYMSNVTINGTTHNVVFVATEHDSVYAYDADTAGPPLWQTSFLINGATPLLGNSDYTILPEIGITGTPVIDPIAGVLYVVAETVENGNRIHRLHALDVTSGNDIAGSPVVITTNGFQAVGQMQRPGLLLANGDVYIAFGSLGPDNTNSNGWVFAYSTSNLAQLAAWTSTPGQSLGSVWMAGSGLAGDPNGNVYFSTGNGLWNGTTLFGDSWVALSPNLTLVDFFTPWNQATLNSTDMDLGSGGVLLVPDQSGAYPHEIIGCGKSARVYVVNRDNMGHFHAGSNSQIIQEVDGVIGNCYNTPAYWNQNVYFLPQGSVIKAFYLDPNTGLLSSTPTSQGSFDFSYPAGQPVVSANGSSNGLVWIVEGGTTASLHVYDATNLAHELYRSGTMPFTKWVPPTVTNGKVYIPAATSLFIYGLY